MKTKDFYSIWEPYKPEYIADKKKISKSQQRILKNKEPEFLSDETKEGWLIDQKIFGVKDII